MSDIFFEKANLKMSFLSSKFIFWQNTFQKVIFKKALLKMYFWESNFENVFFEMTILKMYFLEWQFENVIFEGAILKMYFFEGAVLKESNEE